MTLARIRLRRADPRARRVRARDFTMAFVLRSMRPVSNFFFKSSRINPVTCVNSYRFKSGGKGKSDDGNESDRPSIAEKFTPLDENVSEEIIDFHEESFGFRWDEKHQMANPEMYVYRKKNKPATRAKQVDVKRGVEGVFDLKELVDVLKDERMKDVAVIRIPKSANYCDYMVLATAKSKKHLDAVIEYTRKLYKRKKLPSDPFLPATVGEDSTWRILDMGYIVVHLFMSNVREVYEIESLWCLGPELDEKTIRPDYGEVITQMEKHIKFLQEMQPLDDSSGGRSQETL